MWALIVFAVAVTALVAYVWVRQRRHPLSPGKHASAEAELQNRGAYRGKTPGGGPF